MKQEQPHALGVVVAFLVALALILALLSLDGAHNPCGQQDTEFYGDAC